MFSPLSAHPPTELLEIELRGKVKLHRLMAERKL